MTNNEPVLLPLLGLITARAEGAIGGPNVDLKIDEMINRMKAQGLVVEVAIAHEEIWKHDA